MPAGNSSIDCVEVPLADGGDGLLDVLGGANRTATVTGPLGDPVDAGWRLSHGTAVIEMAHASGLVLVGGADGNDPLDATTTGTGELIDQALDAGARRIIVGLGGSATTDGGFGAHPGDHRHRTPEAGRAARRLRRQHHVHRCRHRVRAAEGRHRRRRSRCCTTPRTDGPDVLDRLRRRRERRSWWRRRRRTRRRPGRPRSATRARLRTGRRRSRPLRPPRGRRPRRHRRGPPRRDQLLRQGRRGCSRDRRRDGHRPAGRVEAQSRRAPMRPASTCCLSPRSSAPTTRRPTEAVESNWSSPSGFACSRERVTSPT